MAELLAGQPWVITAVGTALPTLAVTKPDGSTLTPAVEFAQSTDWDDQLVLDPGNYAYTATVPGATMTVPGRWLATIVAASAIIGVEQAFVTAVTANTAYPDADSLDDWLGGSAAHSFTAEEMDEEMAVALQQQRNRCNIPVAYPEQLREAAHRRAARLLYLRRQLTEQPRTDGDFDTPATLPSGRDFNTRELEAQYLKTPVG